MKNKEIKKSLQKTKKTYTKRELTKLLESMTVAVLNELENPQEQPAPEQKAQESAPHADPKKQLILALKELKHAISELNESELVKNNAQMLKMLPRLSGMVGKVIGYCKTNLINKPAQEEQPQEDETSQEIANTKI